MRRILIAVSSAALTTAALLADDIVLPDGKAKTTIQNACSECHGLEQIVDNVMSREDWRKTVNSMVKRGASLSPAEIDSVVDYLSVYFSPEKVNVNTASSKELQNALGLNEAQANAVVEHRTKNGKIQDLPSLTKAAGVDAAKIDSKKDLIVF